MKIKSFKASNVHGFLEFDLEFDEKLVLLTGVNGSGKTTVLKLIDALLSNKLKLLAAIKFTYINLTVEVNTKIICIEARSKSGTITLTANEKNEFSYKIYAYKNKRKRFMNPEGENEYYLDLRRDNYETAYFSTINKIPDIHFLSLDRDFSKTIDSRRIARNTYHHRYNRSDRNNDTSYLESSYIAANAIITDEFERVRDIEKKLESALKSNFISSSFNFIKHDDVFTSFFEGEENNLELTKKKAKQFLEKEDEFLDLIAKLFSDEVTPKDENQKITPIREQLSEFFSQLKKTLNTMDSKKDNKGVNLEVLINFGQLLRMEELNKIVTKFNTDKERINKKLNQFLDVINFFYQDSGKKVELTSIGIPQVTSLKNPDAEINGLSSGEIHIFVMMAFLGFHNSTDKPDVIFVDEPELSLHIHWQEHLIEKIRTLNNTTQLIFATHSPEIIGDFRGQCVPVQKKRLLD